MTGWAFAAAGEAAPAAAIPVNHAYAKVVQMRFFMGELYHGQKASGVVSKNSIEASAMSRQDISSGQSGYSCVLAGPELALARMAASGHSVGHTGRRLRHFDIARHALSDVGGTPLEDRGGLCLHLCHWQAHRG